MFSRNKLAAASGLLGGLVMICAGATEAYAGGSAGTCARDTQGNITCMQRNGGGTGDDGGFALHQAQDCLSTKPLSLPAGGLLNKGAMHIGPSVNCSNSNSAPPVEGLEAPAFGTEPLKQ
ncbi:hypothetical protein AB0D04_00670 [Streptomyces sp. NPDC048483]|uniref:hypothetical protein n=1 Tax=Streptomyces sp. NPDC048483 TaxID=3154927 RepID=UPI0034165C5C